MSAALPSIGQRLARALMLGALVWGLTASAVIWFVVHHEVDEIMDNTLQESSEILYGLLSFHQSRLPLNGQTQALPAPPHDEQLVWQIVHADGRLLLRSHRAPDTAMARPGMPGFSTNADLWRVYAMPLGAEGNTLLVAQQGAERLEARVEVAAVTVAATLLVGLCCALWLSRKVRCELQPVSALSAAVGQFDPLATGASLKAPDRQEQQPMHQAITELGTRLARRVRHERAFSAHAAHSLRTPLAGIVVQLAAAQKVSSGQALPMLALAREAADRLRSVVAAMLTLFRTGGEIRWQPVDLAHLAAHLAVDTLHIQVETPPTDANGRPCTLYADPDLLAAALVNLLENAQRHGAHHVRLGWAPDGDARRVRLQDDGPGMPPAQRERLNAAIGLQAYEGVTGLGLMLADLAARAHGGGISLLPSATGLCVELRLGSPPA